MKKFLIVTVLGLVLGTIAYSQVPKKISYQGLLTSSGTPVPDGSYNLTFKLYTDSSGGTPLWTETHTGVPVSNGTFSVILGQTTSLDGISFAQQLYLAVEEGSNPEFSPRTTLTSAPYALQSLSMLGPGSIATGLDAVAGGRNNRATGDYAVVGGGLDNIAGDTTVASAGISRKHLIPLNPFNNPLGATIGGGERNRATSNYTTAGGGLLNHAGDGTKLGGQYATVGGGNSNQARGSNSTVGGGANNAATGSYATVGGGSSNDARDLYTTVGGGFDNTATSGIGATVGGGSNNTASGSYATVGGGETNSANQQHATVAGGSENTASQPNATVGGGHHNAASGSYATVGGGISNIASGGSATVSGGDLNTASGGSATVGGGDINTASGSRSTVGGGNENTASGAAATVGGGWSNTASDDGATVAGGQGNTASEIYATVGGGFNNSASGGYATAGGGFGNSARGAYSVISGGGGADDADSNSASGSYSMIPGGRANRAAGDFSFAAGRRAKATHQGSFVWGDSEDEDFASELNDQFRVRARGGMKVNKTEVAPPSSSPSIDAGTPDVPAFWAINGVGPDLNVSTGHVGVWGITHSGFLNSAGVVGDATISSDSITYGVWGRSKSTIEMAASVNAEGNGVEAPGIPKAAALRIEGGAITVKRGVSGVRPAGSITVSGFIGVHSSTELSCGFIHDNNMHWVGAMANADIVNPLIKPDSFIYLTVLGNPGAWPVAFAQVIDQITPGVARIRVGIMGIEENCSLVVPNPSLKVRYLIVNPLDGEGGG
jgi:hypothetical protein